MQVRLLEYLVALARKRHFGRVAGAFEGNADLPFFAGDFGVEVKDVVA